MCHAAGCCAWRRRDQGIAAITVPGTFADNAAVRVIDATGKIVMPGGIDPDVHMSHPFMTPDKKELLTRGSIRSAWRRFMVAPRR